MSAMTAPEKDYLRSLAKKFYEISQQDIQNKRRDLWRKKNSLKLKRPLIYIRATAWNELEESKCKIEDPFFRFYEDFFKKMIYQDSLNDDFIIEPWITLEATLKCTGWGVEGEIYRPEEEGGAWKENYPLKDPEDIEKLVVPHHEIDEAATAANLTKLQDALGDIVEINLDRGAFFRHWASELSYYLGYLRGIENIMMDMMDRPEWLHRLSEFLSDGILKTHQEAEDAGDWGLANSYNQAMPYSEELQPPAANAPGCKRKDLWLFAAAQEFTAVSPAMHEEFLLQYQLPIMKEFGLISYGCCEDLTNKIDMIRQIPNLRRIAVSPFANVAKCAEQIKEDYVISYRPSPADMVSYGFDKERIRKILFNDISLCKDSYMDITLKDVETVQKDSSRIRNWVAVTREIIDEVWG